MTLSRVTFGATVKSPAVRTDADGTHPRCDFSIGAQGFDLDQHPDFQVPEGGIAFASPEAELEYRRAIRAHELAGADGPNPYLLHVLLRGMCDRHVTITIEVAPAPDGDQLALEERAGEAEPPEVVDTAIEATAEEIAEALGAVATLYQGDAARAKRSLERDGERYVAIDPVGGADGVTRITLVRIVKPGDYAGRCFPSLEELQAAWDSGEVAGGSYDGLTVKIRNAFWVMTADQVTLRRQADGEPETAAASE